MNNQKNYIIINNKQDILGIYNDINIALNIILDNYILQFESILDVLEQNKFFKLSHIRNSYKIKVILINSNIILKEIYFCFKKFIFYDSNTNSNYFNEDDYTFINKIGKRKKLYNTIIETNTKQELNIFIPNNIFKEEETVIESDIQNNILKEEEIDIQVSKEELLKRINDLENQESSINNTIDQLKEDIQESEDYIISNNNNNNKIEEQIKKIKNKNEEFKSRFDANNKVYEEIKFKINDNEMDIPDIFQYDYEIFKYLEDNNIIDYDEKLKIFKDKLPQNINYNTKYDSMFN